MLEATFGQAKHVFNAKERRKDLFGDVSLGDDVDLRALIALFELGNEWRKQEGIAEPMVWSAHKDAVDPLARDLSVLEVFAMLGHKAPDPLRG